MSTARRLEIAEKTTRLQGLLDRENLAGVLLTTQPGFSWFSAGGGNGIDVSREEGAGALFVTRAGQRYVFANTIEMPRLLAEEIGNLGFEPIELPWAMGPATPRLMVDTAERLVGVALPIAADWPIAGAKLMDGAIARLRYALTDGELERIEALGRDVGNVLGDVARGAIAGRTERALANELSAALGDRNIRTPVALIAADDRLRQFRHPVPTDQVIRRVVMLVICGRRQGLTVSASRIVSLGPVDHDLDARTQSCARVFGHMLAASRPGAYARDVFATAVAAYNAEGFAGEETRHHQGGACGYRTRDWLAHAASTEIFSDRQALAWNPSIAGTKVEDTVVLRNGQPCLITPTLPWPLLRVDAPGLTWDAPGVLYR